VHGAPAVAITGNVFIDPTKLPSPRRGLVGGITDWDMLNTVIPWTSA
jgi:hypothetical protein